MIAERKNIRTSPTLTNCKHSRPLPYYYQRKKFSKYAIIYLQMPEMNSCAESEENRNAIGEKFIYFLQNLGLLTGFGIMLLMAVYGGNINFE